MAATSPVKAQEELEKQPVFLFCPHSEQGSAWSLYVLVDKNDPSKPLALGLETLVGKNSRQMTYESVLKAQKDPATPRELVAQLDAKDFATGRLEVKENNLLSISVHAGEDGLKLTVDARVSLDQHFVVGGPEEGRRDMVLQYSSVYQRWRAKATTLEAADGHNAVRRFALPITGIVFVAGATSISRIAAVDDLGGATILMDR
jgi:hypothetical protein